MTYGLTHGAGAKPLHEYRPNVRRTNGYSVQQSVRQVSGRPDEDLGTGYQAPRMTRFDSEGDSGDYKLSESAAGYDLQGIGGEKVHDTPPDNPPTQGRQTREVNALFTHPGYEQRGSDYDHPGERGFRFRNKEAT